MMYWPDEPMRRDAWGNPRMPIDPSKVIRIDSEADYQEHISNEGDGVANDHPDGCFYCGSPLHHSQDCPNKEEER